MSFETPISVSLLNNLGVTDSSEPFVLVGTRRILVVDDNEAIRLGISTTLSLDGYEVNTASDGQQAWETLHNKHYDLLVTDNEMPHLTGLELIDRIRGEGHRLPIILASGSIAAENMRDDPQLKIDAVLPKPFDITELLNLVRDLLFGVNAFMEKPLTLGS